MEGLTACFFGLAAGGHRLLLPSSSPDSRAATISFRRHSFRVLASANASDGGGPQLDKWDEMELNFGKLLGEDPKLTLAKIMARKSNPDVSYLEIEKQFREGKLDPSLLNPPKPQPKLSSESQLNLPRRPLMKKPSAAAVQPSQNFRPTPPSQRPLAADTSQPTQALNVNLRKPMGFQSNEDQIDSKMKVKPNLFLKMRKNSDEELTDVTLLKKPEIVKISVSTGENTAESNLSGNLEPLKANEVKKPDRIMVIADEGKQDNLGPQFGAPIYGGLQPEEQRTEEPGEDIGQSSRDTDASAEAALLGKPDRPDSSAEEVLYMNRSRTADPNNDISGSSEVDQFISEEQIEREDNDWKRAEHLMQTGEKDEVELISCSSRGFVVSFGSLIGFLPYRNLGSKWKFLAFESWLRQKGLNPSMYRKNLNILGSYDTQNRSSVLTNEDQDMDGKDEEALSGTSKFEELLQAYDQAKTKFLSSFVGQRLKVSVILADRKSRRLMFSGRPKEKEEMVEKKKNVMAKLSIGDIVKCRIKNITYFGIFVEVEGVPALIHQSEVSWDAMLDPSSYYKPGQVVDAKVHQLDFALERITLSLKEIMPDPLMEALESVVGEGTSLGGSLEAAQADVELADVESLIKELQQTDGILDVSKGRFFLSPGLAPTFQVYMASMFDNQYKLLARYGNKVQEVIVQSSLDKEQMKKAILTCTNRVE